MSGCRQEVELIKYPRALTAGQLSRFHEEAMLEHYTVCEKAHRSGPTSTKGNMIQYKVPGCEDRVRHNTIKNQSLSETAPNASPFSRHMGEGFSYKLLQTTTRSCAQQLHLTGGTMVTACRTSVNLPFKS